MFHPAPDEVFARAAVEFDAVLAELHGSDTVLDLTGRTDRPVWQLLVHAAGTGRYALHGSGEPDIDEFEPRQSNDVDDFGNREGVYAAADGLWPMYFAIVDRPKITSLMNAAFVRVDPDSGAESHPLYFFSISSPEPAPWRQGTVYLLPIAGFERQPELHRPDGVARTMQLFNPAPVRPVAKVRVQPSDFPMLELIRRHDHEEIGRRAAEDPQGFPWL